MTTRQFFQRLLQPLAPSSLENLSANEAMDMVGALNAALSDFYRFAPDRYRKIERHYGILAPREFEADFVKGEVSISNVTTAGAELPDAMVVEGTGNPGIDGLYSRVGNLSVFPRYVAVGSIEEIYMAATWELLWHSAIITSTDSTSPTPDLVDSWSYPNMTVRRATWADFPSQTLTLAEPPGSTVIIDGQGGTNEIGDSGNDLMHAFAGETGRYRLKLFSDVIPLGAFFVERMYLHPIMKSGRILEHDGALQQLGPHSEQFGRQGIRTKQVGTPRRYGIRHTGSFGGSVQPAALLVLDPMPSAEDSLRLGLVHQAMTFGMSAWAEELTIPLPESICWDILLPLAWGQLTLSALWRDSQNKKDYTERASDARFAARSLPEYVGVPNHGLGRPHGW